MDTDLLHGEFVVAVARCGGKAAYARVAGCSRQAVAQAIVRRSPMPWRHVIRVARHLGEPRWRFRPDVYPQEEASAAVAS